MPTGRLSVAKRAGVSGSTAPAVARPRWTPEADARLRFFWDTPASTRVLCARFGRSAQAIGARARMLGLPARVPPGYEFFTHAAQRVNFDLKTLHRILAWAGVETCRVRSSEMKRRPIERRCRARYHQSFVDPFDVDEAVARWLAAETPAQAAPRVGVDPTTLRRWLREAGVPQVGHRHEWRLDVAVIDAVAAQHRTASHIESTPVAVAW